MRGHKVALLAALLGAGCGATNKQLATRAAADFACDPSELRIQSLDGRTRQVTGCGRRAIYVSSCTGAYGANCVWILNADIQSTSGPDPAAVAEAPEEPSYEEARIEQDQARDGSKRLKLYLRGDKWMIFVRATPRTDIERAAIVWRVIDLDPNRDCQIKLVANGTLVEVGAEVKKTVSKRRADYQSTVSYTSLLDMARSQRVVGQLCDTEVTLSDAQLEKLKELVIRIREVQVLSADTPPAEQASPSSDRSLL